MKVSSCSSLFVLVLLAAGQHWAPSQSCAAPPPAATPVQGKPVPAAPHQAAANSIGMRLVLVPAGEFLMGSVETLDSLLKAFPAHKVEAKTDYLFKDETPQHRVRITRPFYLGQHEVTVGQFRKFVAESGYKTEAESDGKGGWGYNPKTGKCEGREPQYHWLNPGFRQTDEHPVVNVTWNDAVEFCKWLSRKEGKQYRLPTEAEWEYACRAGTTTRYHMGDDPAALVKAANVEDPKDRTEFPHVQQIQMSPDGTFTLPVGKFKPNALGLYDMHGNVWEWCSDWYGKEYYAQSPADDPPGAEPNTRRVRRGGAWNSFPLYARASFRNWNSPQSRCVNLGFRVVLSTEVPPPAAPGATAPAAGPDPATSGGAGQD